MDELQIFKPKYYDELSPLEKELFWYTHWDYMAWQERQNGEWNGHYQTLLQCFERYNPNFVRVRRLHYSRSGKISRIKKFIQKCFDSDSHVCVFGTLTFDDEHLDLWNAETRQREVRNYLNRFPYPYVANIDFGVLKGREHYHFLINGFCDPSKWKGGQIAYLEKVRSVKDSPQLARYLGKLASHAVKRGLKLIWSRGKKFDFTKKGDF